MILAQLGFLYMCSSPLLWVASPDNVGLWGTAFCFLFGLTLFIVGIVV